MNSEQILNSMGLATYLAPSASEEHGQLALSVKGTANEWYRVYRQLDTVFQAQTGVSLAVALHSAAVMVLKLPPPEVIVVVRASAGDCHVVISHASDSDQPAIETVGPTPACGGTLGSPVDLQVPVEYSSHGATISGAVHHGADAVSIVASYLRYEYFPDDAVIAPLNSDRYVEVVVHSIKSFASPNRNYWERLQILVFFTPGTMHCAVTARYATGWLEPSDYDVYKPFDGTIERQVAATVCHDLKSKITGNNG